MKNLIIILISSLFASAFAPSSIGRFNLIDANKSKFRYVLTTPVRSPYEIVKYVSWLRQNDFDVAGYNWKKNEVEVITDSAGITKLEELNLRGKIVETREPGQTRAQSVDPRFLNPEKVEAKLKALNNQYPKITRLVQIGTSFLGRPIWSLLISSTPNPQSPEYYQKPAIIIDGLHHAREIMTPEVVMDVADTLLNPTVRQDRRWLQLFENWNVWVVPMLNVDGNTIVWTEDNMWRKNAHAENNRTFGVDINRNYAFKWNNCNGSSGFPSSDTYRGAAAGSEPETQALIKLADSVIPTAYLSYHSFSELVLYPYGCQGIFTGENALLSKIGGELAQVLPRDSNDGNYTPGTPWQLLYSVDGDSGGHMFGEYGALSFTFEVNQAFQPRYELREPTLVKHRKAWAYFFNRMNQNLFTLKVVDGKTGQPAQAQIRIANIVVNQGEKPYRTNIGGNYFKVLDPGRYTFSLTLKDGRKAQFDIDMKGASQEKTVTVN